MNPSWELKVNVVESLRKLSTAVDKTLSEIVMLERGSPTFLLRSLPAFFVTKQRSGQFKFHSAFLYMLWEGTNTLTTVLILVFGHRYNSARVLYRLALESVIRGAFFNAISQEKYRNAESSIDACVSAEINGTRRRTNLRNELFSTNTKINEDIKEYGSITLLDVIQEFQKDEKRRILLPSVREMASDLGDWGLLSGSLGEESSFFYGDLSQAVHLRFETTDVGARLTRGLNPFEEPVFIRQEFEESIEELDWIMEILMTLTMNVLRDNLELKDFQSGLREALDHMSLGDDELPYFQRQADIQLSM